jgi:membrane protein DedA with SNARE-associated domain
VTLDQFLIAHGSALILPLAIVEGPIVSILTGFLAAKGYFDWWWALCLLVAGDLIGDLIFYWVGRHGRTPLAWVGRRLGIARAFTPEVQNGLKLNATKMLIVGKWTHTAGCAVLVGSGMLHLPVLRFLLVNFVATVPKSALLLGFGYFAGDYYPMLERHVVLGTVLALLAGIAAMVVILRRTDGGWAGR